MYLKERNNIKSAKEEEFIKWFPEISNKDILIAGGKGASLAEMYNNNFPVPPGFIITAQAYDYFMEKSGIREKIHSILSHIDTENTENLEKASLDIRETIEKALLPSEMAEQIIEAYEVLDVDTGLIQQARDSALEILRKSHEPLFVAVRSSATTEDLADASFAGQQESFLNVKGKQNLLKKVKSCFASLFTARAIYYRKKKGFDSKSSKLAVVVQKMIDSEKSGVMFSKDPVSSDNNIIIEAVWGLGEGIVSGMVKPDYYKVSRDVSDFKILDLKISEKKFAVVRNSSGENMSVKLGDAKRNKQVLSDREIKLLAQYGKRLEEYYKKPQDVEFAIAGGEIFIVQSRPITTYFSESKKEESRGDKVLAGLGASPGIASGKVKIIHKISDLNNVEKGDVLVTEMTNPDMVVSMQKASAIVTNEGGITSHAAIVSREMGIPAVVGTENATFLLKDGDLITVDGTSGIIYQGIRETRLLEIKRAVPTKTKIKVIVDLPEAAERAAKTGLKAVGLVRLEGIIALSGKHPLYFINNKKSDEYISLIFNGLKRISEYFDDMWIRTSDLRSDEFCNLEGAPKEKEGNPMLGNHGIRFSLQHPDIHKCEIRAIKKLSDAFKDKKFGIMIPQVISVDEIRKTKEIAREIGITSNIKIGIMVETPAAVQIINSICEEGIDFISFGTNDLTQYMLAIDRNNSSVQTLFDELNPAVTSALGYVIRRCRKYGVESSICGQAASREEMDRFLVGEGIDSITVNADAAEKVSIAVASLEGNAGGDAGNEIDKSKGENNKSSESEYSPGYADSERNKNVPPLHEAIPISSEMFSDNIE